jgi:hypothetical protein
MKKSLLVEWLQKELKSDEENWLPLKNLETDPKSIQLIEEDPECVVLFDGNFHSLWIMCTHTLSFFILFPLFCTEFLFFFFLKM